MLLFIETNKNSSVCKRSAFSGCDSQERVILEKNRLSTCLDVDEVVIPSDKIRISDCKKLKSVTFLMIRKLRKLVIRHSIIEQK